MKTYKKPEIELSSFETDIITTSTLTVDEKNGGVYTATAQNAAIDFAAGTGKITISPWK